MKVKKAYEITDAKIQFVSLVDKAANLKSFLITKAQDGQATFSTYGKIVAKDADHHFVTGVVYEPMAEDAHGNFMTEDEITKAAYFFAKSGAKVDLQHSFEPLSSAEVVESWIAKADFALGDETIKKGTWLMTVELSDDSLWSAIEKGEITGFSMGGVGNYSEEDVSLENVEKATTESSTAEKRGLFKKLAAMFGMDVVEKGAMADLFQERNRSQQFWTANYALQDVLSRYDGYDYKEVLEADEAKVREALEDFSRIVTEILTGNGSVLKAIAAERPVQKAGKKMSGKNRETLQGIYDSLGTFLKEFADPEDEPKNENKEETEVTKAEIEKLVETTVTASVQKALGEQQLATTGEEITPESVQKMVDEAVAKALTPEQAEEPITGETVVKMVSEAVAKAVEPVLKARGVPSALNDGESAPVEKQQETHYLHGIL